MKPFLLIGAAAAGALLTSPTLAADPPATPGPQAPASPLPQTARQDPAGVPVADRGDAVTWKLVTNGPIPDTAATRAAYPPLSHGGRHTKAAGN